MRANSLLGQLLVIETVNPPADQQRLALPLDRQFAQVENGTRSQRCLSERIGFLERKAASRQSSAVMVVEDMVVGGDAERRFGSHGGVVSLRGPDSLKLAPRGGDCQAIPAVNLRMIPIPGNSALPHLPG